MTVFDYQMDRETWRNAWLYYRAAPHQEAAIDILYDELLVTDPTVLLTTSDWFRQFRDRNLVKSFMHPEGE